MKSRHQVAAGNASPGDWIEADAPGGGPGRHGQILEVLGAPGHRHYRVRWDEAHESIFYPADGARLFHGEPRQDSARRRRVTS